MCRNTRDTLSITCACVLHPGEADAHGHLWAGFGIAIMVIAAVPSGPFLCLTGVVVLSAAGGMLAAYHRLKRPDVFAAAVAASAPMQYICEQQLHIRFLQSTWLTFFVMLSACYGSTSLSCGMPGQPAGL